ncbi:hypothetical protein LWI29_019544 [Acer saccharum]|uniref:Uncharacterized protein n=1 Tax=Acer saccharum TaxID=4024 RepID=A0AA39W8N6_ACESA|nr:hypothetical protein LWI29_019544 [Acer saccharum]
MHVRPENLKCEMEAREIHVRPVNLEKDAVEGAPTIVVGEMSSLNTSLGERDKRKQDGKEKKKAPKSRSDNVIGSCDELLGGGFLNNSFKCNGEELSSWCEELEVLPIPSSEGPDRDQQIKPIHSFELGLLQVVSDGPSSGSADEPNLEQAQQFKPIHGDKRGQSSREEDLFPFSIGGSNCQVGKVASPSSQSKNRRSYNQDA